MRYLIIFFIVIFFSCKNQDSNKEQGKITSQLDTIISVSKDIDTLRIIKEDFLNTQDVGLYKSINSVCDKKEFPLYCSFQNELEVSFLFDDEPNKIVIGHKKSTFTHRLPFFEGLDYSPYVLKNNKDNILIIELVFEYGKKYVVFRILEDKISFLKDFYIDDLIDDNEEFVEHTFSIIQSKKDFVLQIGKEPFIHKELLFN